MLQLPEGRWCESVYYQREDSGRVGESVYYEREGSESVYYQTCTVYYPREDK